MRKTKLNVRQVSSTDLAVVATTWDVAPAVIQLLGVGVEVRTAVALASVLETSPAIL